MCGWVGDNAVFQHAIAAELQSTPSWN